MQRSSDTYSPCRQNFSESPSITGKYLFFLKVADEFELEGYTVEDFYDWIAEPLLPTFRQLDTLTSVSDTLEALLYPETYHFTLCAKGDSLVAVPQYGETQNPLFGIILDDEICSLWPPYRPPEVQPVQDSNRLGPPSPIPSKVLLTNRTAAFLKMMHPGDQETCWRNLTSIERFVMHRSVIRFGSHVCWVWYAATMAAYVDFSLPTSTASAERYSARPSQTQMSLFGKSGWSRSTVSSPSCMKTGLLGVTRSRTTFSLTGTTMPGLLILVARIQRYGCLRSRRGVRKVTWWDWERLGSFGGTASAWTEGRRRS